MILRGEANEEFQGNPLQSLPVHFALPALARNPLRGVSLVPTGHGAELFRQRTQSDLTDE
jgi:hypothetical protein